MAWDGPVAQELFHLRRAQRGGMLLALEQDEALDPVHLRWLGTDAVVLEAELLAHLIQEAGLVNHAEWCINIFNKGFVSQGRSGVKYFR
jgi:hypothetical protein